MRPQPTLPTEFPEPDRSRTRFPIRLFLAPGVAVGGVIAALTSPLVLHDGWLVLGQVAVALVVCLVFGLVVGSRKARPTPATVPSPAPKLTMVRTPTILR